MAQTGSRRFKPGSAQPPRNLDFCFIRLFDAPAVSGVHPPAAFHAVVSRG